MAVASAALGDLTLQRAARASIYAHAGQIMLRYFNHEHNRNDAELKEIRDSAQEWCVQYFKVPTFRDVRNSPDCALNYVVMMAMLIRSCARLIDPIA